MLPGDIASLFDAAGRVGNDANTVLLLHFNDMKFMNDAKGGVPAIGTPYSATLNSTIKKFGNSSLYFPGGPLSWMNIPNSANYDFGTGNFTIDWWQYPTAIVQASATVRRQADNNPQAFLLCHSASGRGQCYMSSTNTAGGAWDIANAQDWGTIDINTWTHYAVVRSGTTFYLFKNGIQTATWTSSLALAAGLDRLTLGYWGGNTFKGHLDEFRISKGVARWTANFVPPVAQYGPSIDRTAYHTVYVSHFDGGGAGTSSAQYPDASPYAKGNTTGPTYNHPLSKFGNGSLYFDGGQSFYTYLPGSEDFNFGNGDFTIDWWDYRSDGSSARPALVRSGMASDVVPLLAGWSSGSTLYFDASSNNSSWDIVQALSMGPFTAGVWSHRAVSRKDGVFYTFKDGVLQATANGGNLPIAADTLSQGFLVGWWNQAGGANAHMYGLIDEVRVTKGVALWTTNFTPSNVPYGPVPLPAVRFDVYIYAGSTTPGTAFTCLLVPRDVNGAETWNYPGNVHFTTNCPSATLPGDINIYGRSQVQFNATMYTVGSFTITARDTVNGSIVGTSNAITVARPRPASTQWFAVGGGAGSFTVPADWTDDNNQFHVYGGGGGGGNAAGGSYSGGGGGGGGYARYINLPLTPGQVLTWQVGDGGVPQGGSGGMTIVNGVVLATGGAGAINAAGGGGVGQYGNYQNCTGGRGGYPGGAAAGSGGGAAGPYGDGGAGGDGQGNVPAYGGGGGSGGSSGNDTGYNGGYGNSGGGWYGNNGAYPGGSGVYVGTVSGGGGGGGNGDTPGGSGGTGAELNAAWGSGGGGGGGSGYTYNSTHGGQGGYYGGGGGGGGQYFSLASGGYPGSPGLIVIQWGP